MGDIFKFSASAAGGEFCEWVQIPIVKSIRLNLINIHGLQLLALLP